MNSTLADQQDRSCELKVDGELDDSSSPQVCEADEVTSEAEVDPSEGTDEAVPNEDAFCLCLGGRCCGTGGCFPGARCCIGDVGYECCDDDDCGILWCRHHTCWGGPD